MRRWRDQGEQNKSSARGQPKRDGHAMSVRPEVRTGLSMRVVWARQARVVYTAKECQEGLRAGESARAGRQCARARG